MCVASPSPAPASRPPHTAHTPPPLRRFGSAPSYNGLRPLRRRALASGLDICLCVATCLIDISRSNSHDSPGFPPSTLQERRQLSQRTLIHPSPRSPGRHEPGRVADFRWGQLGPRRSDLLQQVCVWLQPKLVRSPPQPTATLRLLLFFLMCLPHPLFLDPIFTLAVETS